MRGPVAELPLLDCLSSCLAASNQLEEVAYDLGCVEVLVHGFAESFLKTQHIFPVSGTIAPQVFWPAAPSDVPV